MNTKCQSSNPASSVEQPRACGQLRGSIRDKLLVGFAVVFEGPHGIPEIGALGCDHAAFTGGGEDLVLAEAPGGHITEAAHGLAMDAGAMGLGAVFEHGNDVSEMGHPFGQ